jgi:hypothetical protein
MKCKCGCGAEVPTKGPHDHGPQRLYATSSCRSRDTAKASRERKTAVQLVVAIQNDPQTELPLEDE